MDPLFSVVMCGLVCNRSQAARLGDRMSRIHQGGKSVSLSYDLEARAHRLQNVALTITALRWMRDWQDRYIKNDIYPGWFKILRISLPLRFSSISLG